MFNCLPKGICFFECSIIVSSTPEKLADRYNMYYWYVFPLGHSLQRVERHAAAFVLSMLNKRRGLAFAHRVRQRLLELRERDVGAPRARCKEAV